MGPMTRSGLESKFNMQRYLQLVQRKCREAVVAEPRLLSILPKSALGGSDGAGALLRVFAQCSTPRRSPEPGAEDKFIRPTSATSTAPSSEAADDSTTKTITPSKVTKRVSSDVLDASTSKRREVQSSKGGLHRFFASKPGETSDVIDVDTPSPARKP